MQGSNLRPLPCQGFRYDGKRAETVLRIHCARFVPISILFCIKHLQRIVPNLLTETQRWVIPFHVMNATHKRAKKGGQVGANGEWYEGGQFVSVAGLPKSKKRTSNTSRRVEVEPYVWEVSRDGMAPIYRCMRGLEFVVGGRAEFNFSLRGEYATPEEVARRIDRIFRFNSGERWEPV